MGGGKGPGRTTQNRWQEGFGIGCHRAFLNEPLFFIGSCCSDGIFVALFKAQTCCCDQLVVIDTGLGAPQNQLIFVNERIGFGYAFANPPPA